MKRSLTKLFSVGLLCLSFYVIGQEKPITGKVVDSNGYPVQDAYVYVDGSNKGVYTDAKGNYTLEAKKGDIINVEFIGFDTKKIKVKNANKYDIKLSKGENAVDLDKLVVIGYGSARDVASSASNVAVVSGETVAKRPSANALDALQGQVAGLQIYTSSGEPSATSSIRLHGVGSLGAGSSPLFILDGMQVSDNILSTLNPSDISSISVLKDAAATSIYGARAANGVVYITTKKGKKGEGTFTIGLQQGYSDLASRKFFNTLMNSEELARLWVETGYKTQAQMDAFLKKYPNDTKWMDFYYKRNAPTKQINASFSGGTDRTSYYVSGGYLEQEGLAFRSGLKRYNLRTNIDSKVKKWLKIGVNVSMSYNRYETNPYDFNSPNRGLAFLAQPFFSPVDEKGKEYVKIPGWGRYNPKYLAEKLPSYSRNLEVLPTGYVEFTPVKNLTLRSQGGFQIWVNRNESNRLSSYLGSLNDGSAYVKAQNNVRKTITNTAEYKFKINNLHNFILLVGQEFVGNTYESINAESGGQTNDKLVMLGQGTKNKNVGQAKSEYAYSSFFGRLEYDFDKKYYFNASLRRDGSSRFGEDNKYANFWSVGLMWKAKKEHMLADVDWLSDLNFKASIGTSGNSDIGNYTSLALVGANQYDGQTGYYITNPGNPALTWEKQTMSSFTTSLGLFNRVNMDVTLYNRQTKSLLMDVPTPYTTGFDEYKANVGTIQNRGIDFELNASVVKTSDFYLNSYVKFNYNRDKITELFQNRKYWIVPGTGVGYALNQPISFLYPILKGVNPETGLKEWYLPNRDDIMTTQKDDSKLTTKFNDDLAQNVGVRTNPLYTGGFGLSTGYKGFSINADFSFALDKHLINNDRFFAENPNVFTGYNQTRNVFNYWKKKGDKAQFPKYGGHQNFTDFDSSLLEDASFMRLKNLTIAYNLPKTLIGKITFLDNVRVYMTGRNLMTLTKYSGPDPEIDSNLSLGANPNTKQYVFGVEIKF